MDFPSILLSVVLTNIPAMSLPEEAFPIETRHAGAADLAAGLHAAPGLRLGPTRSPRDDGETPPGPTGIGW
ncbi:hypothetical protein [Rhabdaerophilum calidifontis]|uniref:hypothetical protein n=1 Tax=Rhabdaerophilum calidifontis TaxID=2604328 RepID=UPI00123AA0A2|nr:hypothetical protein [Rhabdaerophilum calidifontis]